MKARLTIVVALAALVPLGLVAGCLEPSAATTGPGSRAAELYESCLPCHGEGGVGNAAVEAPPIGGLPQWYIEAQLWKFRSSKRGYHFDDLAGMRMRPMALSLNDEAQIKGVAEYIAAMPRPVNQHSVQGGDVSKGKALFSGTCVACHGADGGGNQALNAPAIAGHADWYVLSQLHKFKTKMRGDPAIDAIGGTMQAMSMTLPDEQAMKDVSAYIASMPPAAQQAPIPSPTAPAAPSGEHAPHGGT